MKTSNPIFSRWDARRDAGQVKAGRYAGQVDAAVRQPVGVTSEGRPADDRATGPWATAIATTAGPGADPGAWSGRPALTIDDVVVRTATTLGAVALTAVLSWLVVPVDEANISRSYGLAVGAALVAFVLAMVQTFKRTPVPALILGYAALEGFFLGVLSSATSTYLAPGVVVQAVLGTFAVFAGVLVAYRMRWIRVTRRFSGFVAAAATGFVLLLFADLLFSAFGAGNGLGFGSGAPGIAFGVLGILLGAAFLALDFKQVEDAVAHGAPREDAWLSAFGLTMTLVWIYLEALRVLTIFNSDD